MILKVKDKLKIFRDNYVIKQVQNIALPNFEKDAIRRYRVVFKGRVQKVGRLLDYIYGGFEKN